MNHNSRWATLILTMSNQPGTRFLTADFFEFLLTQPIFNPISTSFVGLEAPALEQNMGNPESALPFLAIDFL